MPTPAEALTLILDRLAPLSARRLPLEAILGMAPSEDLVSAATAPPFTNSAMDGYAVRASELAEASPEHPVRLLVLVDLAARGSAPSSV